MSGEQGLSAEDITRNDGAGRFEVTVDDHLAELTFRRDGNRLVLEHTGVPEAIGGHGIAAHLAEAAFRYARDEGLTVVPQCPYVRAWLAKDPPAAKNVAIEAL
jgi:predicted GNAT family acetyltransferase